MLLGNYSQLNANPGRNIGGFSNPYDWMKVSNVMKFYMGEGTVVGITDTSSFNNGYRPPYTWVLAPKNGGLAIVNFLDGVNNITYSNLAGGILAEGTVSGTSVISSSSILGIGVILASLSASNSLSADIAGVVEMASTLVNNSDLNGALGALVSIVATLIQDSTLSADVIAALAAAANLANNSDLTGAITGVVEVISTLTGSSAFTADVIGLWNMLVTLTGSSTLSADILAVAYMLSDLVNTSTLNLTSGAMLTNIAATITNLSELSPESLAQFLWNSLASSYNAPGTMGQLINAAGGSASPTIIAQAIWDELKTSHTDPNSYGKIVQDMESIVKQVKALTAAGL